MGEVRFFLLTNLSFLVFIVFYSTCTHVRAMLYTRVIHNPILCCRLIVLKLINFLKLLSNQNLIIIYHKFKIDYKSNINFKEIRYKHKSDK
jgi:hypothetical protein